MSLFSRIKNIVRSNLNSKNDIFSDLELNSYRAVHFNDFGEEYFEQQKQKKSEDVQAHTLEQEYYANLELPYGAGFDDIKKSYKRLLKKYHPDKFYGDEKKLAIAQDVVKKLNSAYDYFCDKYGNN